MAAKFCNFTMDTHGHRYNLNNIFPPTLKLRGATLAGLEEARTV